MSKRKRFLKNIRFWNLIPQSNKYLLIFIGLSLFTFLKAEVKSTDKDVVNFFHPGKTWLDTDKVPIQAHACGILKVKDVYYMYGQDQRLGHNNTTGVCCYSSTELYNWKYEGSVLPTNKTPEIFRDSGVLERPKVIYNARTGKYVMWMHLDGDGYTLAQAGVAISNSPTGPFEMVSTFRPLHYNYGYNRMDGGNNVVTDEDKLRLKKIDEPSKGNTFRDMNLFVDDDGNAYVIYSSENNSSLYISKLSDDFLSLAQPAVQGKTWTRAIIDKGREAPALFKNKGTYFLITSGLTGWASNPAGYYTASNVLGPWTSHGNPCVGYQAELTYNAQSTYVLPAPDKTEDSFIFMADSWNPKELGKSTLVWLPFVIAKDNDIKINFLDKWNLDIFSKNFKRLLKPKPVIMEVSDGNLQKELRWKAVKGADGYRIYKNKILIGNTCNTHFKLPTPISNTGYECIVEAFTIKGVNKMSDPVNVNF